MGRRALVALVAAGAVLGAIGARPGPQTAAQSQPLPDRYLHAIGNTDAPGNFAGARDLAVDAEGGVYVVDETSHRVQVFAADGTFERLWGGPGDADGRFQRPQGAAVTGDTVYVADTGNGRIAVFDPDGTYRGAWYGYPSGTVPERERPMAPEVVAVAPDGSIVADDWLTNHVLVFAPDGTFVRRWVPSAGLPAERPVDALAVDAQGRVYVALGEAGVHVFDLEGTRLATWPIHQVSDLAACGERIVAVDGPRTGLRMFDRAGQALGGVVTGDPALAGGEALVAPERVACGADASMYVLDGLRIARFAPDGSFLGDWHSGPPVAGVIDPHAIDADYEGRLYVADPVHGRVQVFDAAGLAAATWGDDSTGTDDLGQPDGIAVALPGEVYVVDRARGQVLQVDAAGTLVRAWGSPGTGPGQFGPGGPGDIATSYDLSPWAPAVWVADPGNARVQMFQPDGQFVRAFGTLGTGDGQFCEGCLGPIVTDMSGRTHVAERARPDQRVQVFDYAGQHIRTYFGQVGEDSRFAPIADLAFASARIFLADPRLRVQVVDQSGQPLGEIDTWAARPDMPIQPAGVAIGSGAQRLYVADGRFGLVHVFGQARRAAWRVAFHGNAWVADRAIVVAEAADLAFDWGAAAPDPALPADGFSLAAERFVTLGPGSDHLTVRFDGRIRLWLDDDLLIDAWQEDAATYDVDTQVTVPGEHLLRLEYADTSGPAAIALTIGPDDPPWTAVPANTPMPTLVWPSSTPDGASATPDGWTATPGGGTGTPGGGTATPGAGTVTPGGGTGTPGGGTGTPGGGTTTPGGGTGTPGGGTATPGGGTGTPGGGTGTPGVGTGTPGAGTATPGAGTALPTGAPSTTADDIRPTRVWLPFAWAS